MSSPDRRFPRARSTGAVANPLFSGSRHLTRLSWPAQRFGGARGQALVWFLALLATCVVVLYCVFNLSQVTTAKQHVVNATDASALAGATQQARLLNFMAYGNRAMVATDVLAAQMVSLDAWLRYVGTGSQNVGTVSQAIPYVGQAIGQVLNALAQAVERVEVPYGTQVLPAAITAFEGLKQAVGGANELAYQGGATLANQAAGHVMAAHRVSANGIGPLHSAPQRPSAAITGSLQLLNEQAWREFSSRYAGSARQRTREVVLAGLDDFTASRDGNALTNLGTPLARLEKRGGTRLLGFERWEAQDTWDLRFRSWSWRRGWQWNDSTVPVGWGRADVGGGGHLRWGNTTAQRLAFDNRRDIADHTPPRWSGISAVRDLSVPARAQVQPELSFVLVAAQPRAALATTHAMGLSAQALSSSPLGSTHLPERLMADQVGAVSAARVYFERPQRGVGDWTAQGSAGQPGLVREDSAKEHASLYNPFWQARLAPVEPTQRAALLSAWGAPRLAAPAVLEVLP
ncbi:MAG: pilus assembly protein TadG-related protein [Pseudomonadota bacterium]